MYKTVGLCYSNPSANYYVCRSIAENMTEQPGAKDCQPEVFVHYDYVSIFPHDFLQTCTKTVVEPIFQLHPGCSLQVDYTPKDLGGFVCHLLLPEKPTSCITFFASEFFSMEFGGADTSNVYLTCMKNVEKMKTNLATTETNDESSRITFAVDVKKTLTIRYGILDDKKISLFFNSSQVNFYLENAIEDVPNHLKSLRILNQSSDANSACCIGVLGIFLYSFSSPANWDRVPSDAAILSTMGCHFSKEEGCRKYCHSNAQYKLVLKMAESSMMESWKFFLHTDDRVCDKNCMASRNQFIFSNESCFFNMNVQFDYEKHSLILGKNSKFGCLYWKYALSLPRFQIEMNVDLTVEDSYVMLWLSSPTIPSYVYLSHIQRDFISFLSDKNPLLSNGYYTKLQMDQPVMCVILYRSNKDVSLYLTRSYYDTDKKSYFIHFVKSASAYLVTNGTLLCDIGESLLGLQFGSSNFSIQSFDIRNYFSTDVLLSGIMGTNVTVSSYQARSSLSYVDCSILTCSTNTSLPTLESSFYWLKKDPYLIVPCDISYRDFALYANKDPEKRSPPVYKLQGHIAFKQEEEDLESFVIAQDPNKDTLLTFHFCGEDSKYDYIWMYDEGISKPLKLILESSKSNGSFSLNTRLSSSGCLGCGLYNFFNICFQNSTLQLLFHSDTLKLSIANLYEACSKSEQVNQTVEFNTLRAIMESFARLQFSWYNTEFNNVMLQLKDRFEIGTQHVTFLLFSNNK